MNIVILKRNSKIIGEEYKGIKCIGNFRDNWTSFLLCRCTCGIEFSIPNQGWRHITKCPICRMRYKTEHKFNDKRYFKYNRIVDAAKRNNIPISEEWDTREKFNKWYDEHIGDKEVRTKTHKNVSHIGPDTVDFITR